MTDTPPQPGKKSLENTLSKLANPVAIGALAAMFLWLLDGWVMEFLAIVKTMAEAAVQ